MKTVKKRILSYGSAVLGALAAMAAYPPLDPTSYLPYYTRCTRLSDQEIKDLAHARLVKEIKYLVRHFKEPAESIEAAELVQFVDWGRTTSFGFTVTYRTPLGQLLDLRVNPACGMELGFPDRLVPPI